MAKYRFLFDAIGKRNAPSQQELAVSLAAVKSTPAPAPAIVNELKAWLEQNADFGLNMDILEEREVLIRPPQWSYVSEPASSPDPMAIAERDQAAEKYVRMMEQQQSVLDDALSLAAFASLGSVSRFPDQRMRDALHALPKGAKMDLNEVFGGLGGEIPGPAPLPPLRTGVLDWANSILRRHESIVSRRVGLIWSDIETAAWSKWKERLQKFRRDPKKFEVDRNDLLLRARQAGPAALFQNEIDEMTLRKWTEALYLATKGGYMDPSVTLIPDWVKDEVRKELIGGRRTMVFIFGDSVTSPTAAWLPSKKNGCLWIDRSSWAEYDSVLHVSDPDKFGPGRVVFAIEVTGPPDVIGQAVRRPLQEWFGQRLPSPSSTVAFIGKDKLPTQVTPLLPYIDDVQSIDDIVSKLQQHLTP